MGSYAEYSQNTQTLEREAAAEEEALVFHSEGEDEEETLFFNSEKEEEDPWWSLKRNKKNQVFLEGYVESSSATGAGGGNDEDDHDSGKGVSRTVSLTDEDLDELKGCLNLGFGFNYEEIPELCNTLPALEVCYSMSQRFSDDQQLNKSSSEGSAMTVGAETNGFGSGSASASGPISNWKISRPGDDPEDVKARLKFWAQTVACTVRLCS